MIDTGVAGFDRGELVERVARQRPLVVGFSVFQTSMANVLEAVADLRAAGVSAHVTLGGHHATFHYEELLQTVPALDSVVRGESEGALIELVERLAAGSPWSDVANLACRAADGRVVANPNRPLIADLDSLPAPWRAPSAASIRATGVAAALSSRGCYADCGFCSVRAFYGLSDGGRWRPRSPESVVDEFEQLATHHGATHVIFLDDNFMGTGARGRRRARAIAAEMQRRGLRLAMSMICRSNDIERGTLIALRDAGLARVDVGIESWVERQLALYNKAVRVSDQERAIEILDSVGIEYRLYMIPVDPCVTVDDLITNVERMGRLGVEHLPHPLFNHLMAFQGTPLATRLEAEGRLVAPPAPRYLGTHEVVWSHPQMASVSAALRRLDDDFRAWTQRIQQSMPWSGRNPIEWTFSRELMAALSHAVLDLAGRYLRRVKADGPDAARGALEAGRSAIGRSVEGFEAARADGRLQRFETVTVALGERRVAYPPPMVQELTGALLGALGSEGI